MFSTERFHAAGTRFMAIRSIPCCGGKHHKICVAHRSKFECSTSEMGSFSTDSAGFASPAHFRFAPKTDLELGSNNRHVGHLEVRHGRVIG